jgi:undecaprenyl phosphate-alpha-L-ara4FN deformylase
MSKTPAAIRIDVDSARDIALLPEFLDLLRLFDIKGTIFVTTGPDRLATNLLKHLADPRSYRKFVKSRPFRYGFQSFDGILRHVDVESACPEVLLRVVSEGHEVGLHGYDHYAWMHKLLDMDEATIKAFINKGLEALTAVTATNVTSFAAPGFTVTNAFLRAMDSFTFNYSSDFKCDEPTPPFFPKTDNETRHVLQIPVSMDSIGELYAEGVQEDEIKLRVHASADRWHSKRLPFVLYSHPVSEVGCYKELFSSILQDLNEDARFTFMTLAHIARLWKGRS